MKFSLILSFLLTLLFFTSCEKKPAGSPFCQQFSLDSTFTAKLDEEWCLKNTGLKIRFGPFIEDSRCNVPEIDCVWAGRYVMGATIDNGDAVQDTFFALHNWMDTLYHANYRIILAKVYPLQRVNPGPIPDSNYSFDLIVKN